MKGILLGGGQGTRLYPMTLATSKQLLAVYNKPVIYYPLATMMLSGIREILIISTEQDLPNIERLLGSGHNFGLEIQYAQQNKPNGIAEALIIGEDFLTSEPCCLILGDNFFYGHDLSTSLEEAAKLESGARVFAYRVNEPERFGVVEFNGNNDVISLEEKPSNPKSSWALTGLYFYDGTASQRARELRPSKRGELEITDLNLSYLKDRQLKVSRFGRGIAWFDLGTPDSLLEASQFVEIVEKRQVLKIACLEEIAFAKGWISSEHLREIADRTGQKAYRDYLIALVDEEF